MTYCQVLCAFCAPIVKVRTSGPLGLWVTPQPSAPTARVADAPPPRPAAAVQWSDGRIAACTYHGPVPSNPAKDSRLCHPRPGAVAHGRRETVPKRRRRRHDPPPPPPPGAGHKVGGRDPMCLSGGLVWAARCAHITDALCTLKPAKDPYLRPLRPPHLDLHGGKPRLPRPQARLPSPGGRLPVVPRQGRPCLKAWAGGPSRRLCASFTPPELP